MSECVRIVDLLTKNSWSVADGDRHLRRRDVAALVRGCVLDLQRSARRRDTAEQRRLHVFCVSSAIEALVAYFVASQLGLRAAVMTFRQARAVLREVPPGCAATIVVPVGRELPIEIDPVNVVRLRFEAAPDEPVEVPHASDQRPRPCELVFATSGSTGPPKFIVCDEARLLANAACVGDYLGLSASDRSLCLFPITLMYGFSTTFCALLRGGHVEFANWSSSQRVVAMCAQYELNILPIIGDWAMSLALHWSRHPKALKRPLVLNASDALYRTQACQILRFADALWNNFGQTEAGPRLFATCLRSVADVESLCYREIVAPGAVVDSRILVEIRRAPADHDGLGELHYVTPFAMKGYLAAGGATSPAPPVIPSGDLFRAGAGGIHYWAGRVSQSIKLNGQYIDTSGVIDDLLGAELVRSAVLRRDRDGSPVLVASGPRTRNAELVIAKTLRRRLPGVNIRVDLRDALPRTESGKIDVPALVAQ